MQDDFDEFDPFRMMKRFEKYFSNMDKGFGMTNLKGNIREPLVDLVETPKEIKVTIELPGIEKKDIDLRVKNNHLIIKAINKSTLDKDDENMVYRERSYQQYYRTVPLPASVDEKKISAKYNNGILEVTIPKKKSDKKEIDKITIS